MKNSEVNNTAVNNKNGKTNLPSITKAIVESKEDLVKKEEVKSAETLPLNNETETKVVTETSQPQTHIDQSTNESKNPDASKYFVPNLDTTLKAIQDLHRKAVQRKNLIDTMETLQSFEINLGDNADETESNVYTGCVVTIKDDKGNAFSTKNPTIIQRTAEYINTMCTERLADIEAGIVFPSMK